MIVNRKNLLRTLLVIAIALLLAVVTYFVFPSAVEERIKGIVEYTQSIPFLSSSNPNGYLTNAGVIARTNAERQAVGLAALTENTDLDAAAQAKLNDMFTNQYFDHISPQGNGPGTLAQNAGYTYLIVGENLALGDFSNNSDLVAAWMASPGHRANILNTRFTDIGVAVGKGMYNGKETWLAVQEFGTPITSCPSIDTSLKTKVDEDRAQSDALTTQLNSLKQELNAMPQDTQTERDAYNAKVTTYNQLVTTYTTLNTTIRTEVDQYNGEVQAFNACLNAN